MPPLSKRDVEALLAAVDSSPDDLRDALAAALGKVLADDGAAFDDLVARAAAQAGWPDHRRDDLLGRQGPEAAREAMWELAAELNELRNLRLAPGRQQREAVSAIERAIKAVNRGDAAAVRTAATTVAQLDAAGVYPDLPAALERLAAALEQGGSATVELRQAAADALGPGPLAAELLG